jgi:ABC-type branched-subunit amino acid transport system permease subunit
LGGGVCAPFPDPSPGTVVVQLLTSYLGTASATYTPVILGTALLAVVLLFPRGLLPALGAAVRRRPPGPVSVEAPAR